MDQDQDLEVKDRDLIFTRLDKLSKKLDSMSVNQIVFGRSRAGLGYEDSQDGSSSTEKDKLMIELKQRIDTFDQALYSCKGSNEFLKDKVHVL